MRVRALADVYIEGSYRAQGAVFDFTPSKRAKLADLLLTPVPADEPVQAVEPAVQLTERPFAQGGPPTQGAEDGADLLI